MLNVYAKPPKGVAPPLSDSVYNTIQIPRCKVSVEGASLIFFCICGTMDNKLNKRPKNKASVNVFTIWSFNIAMEEHNF